MTQKGIKYLALSEDITVKSLFLDRDELLTMKQKIVNDLYPGYPGISPLDQWLTGICTENEVENTRPVPRIIADSIANDPVIFRFMFFLA